MKRSFPIFIVSVCCLVALTGVWVSGQTKVAVKDSQVGNNPFNSISKAEVEMLLTDVAKTNPKLLERLAADPELKQKQIENLRQLLAFASQAEREGLASDPVNKQELDNIKAETIAVNYDKEINKDKGPMPPFGFITDDQVKMYWAEDKQPKSRGSHEAEFGNFLAAKIAILRAGSPEMKDREVSEEEKTQARDIFARTRIYKAEYEQKAKSGLLPKAFIDKVNLQFKLQQAQFLARLYSERLATTIKITDADVANYIAQHPELNTSAKRAKAEDILKRAKAGDNFATLANEFSEDPGNTGPNGKKQGGIYKDVPKGRMVAPFEAAALALEPGQVAPNLVESDFGYHIIKLERKGESKTPDGQTAYTYDVRHILISTTYKDPATPGPDRPIKDYVREKLKDEREDQLVDKLVVDNNIQVPTDFDVPSVAVPSTPKVVKKPPVKRKRPVKKR